MEELTNFWKSIQYLRLRSVTLCVFIYFSLILLVTIQFVQCHCCASESITLTTVSSKPQDRQVRLSY